MFCCNVPVAAGCLNCLQNSINVRPTFLTTHVSQSLGYLGEASYPEDARAEAP